MKIQKEHVTIMRNVSHAVSGATFKELKGNVLMDLAVSIQEFGKLTNEIVEFWKTHPNAVSLELKPVFNAPLPEKVTPIGKKKK